MGPPGPTQEMEFVGPGGEGPSRSPGFSGHVYDPPLHFRGAPKERAPGVPGPSLGTHPALDLRIFQIFQIICIFEGCVQKVFAMWEDQTNMQQGRRLTLR